MILGLGVDLCSIERMREILGRHGDRFTARVLSPEERADLEGREPAATLAGRFAAKEAFAKALGGGRSVAWHDCRVRRAPTGQPRLELVGTALAAARALGAERWHVSLSHDAGAAVAVVVLEGRGPDVRRRARPRTR